MAKFKAFIGPLGEDIPSIFPIVFGIILFLGSIAYVNGLKDEKDSRLSTRQSALELSYLLTERGFMSDSDFANRCSAVKDFAEKKGVKFSLVLQKHCNGIVDYGTDFDKKYSPTLPGQLSGRTCPDVTADDYKTLTTKVKDKAVWLSYSISVACIDGNGFGIMNLFTWSKRDEVK